MKRLQLLAVAVMVGLLLATASAAIAAPSKNVKDVPLVCENGEFQAVWHYVVDPATGYDSPTSFTLHLPDGARYIMHRAIVKVPIDEDTLVDILVLDRGYGAPTVECSLTCPFSGLQTVVWGTFTPVGGR
jgi:hypothetical protein